MTDEEKKAIEIIKNEITRPDTTPLEVYVTDIKILLILIKKQQKEIEELKNGQIDFWISDKEIEERIRNKFVSNDKIKAKIEEYEKEIQIRKNVINNDVLDKQTIEKARIEWACMEDFIYEMQSLLEKE